MEDSHDLFKWNQLPLEIQRLVVQHLFADISAVSGEDGISGNKACTWSQQERPSKYAKHFFVDAPGVKRMQWTLFLILPYRFRHLFVSKFFLTEGLAIFTSHVEVEIEWTTPWYRDEEDPARSMIQSAPTSASTLHLLLAYLVGSITRARIRCPPDWSRLNRPDDTKLPLLLSLLPKVNQITFFHGRTLVWSMSGQFLLYENTGLDERRLQTLGRQEVAEILSNKTRAGKVVQKIDRGMFYGSEYVAGGLFNRATRSLPLVQSGRVFWVYMLLHESQWVGEVKYAFDALCLAQFKPVDTLGCDSQGTQPQKVRLQVNLDVKASLVSTGDIKIHFVAE